MWIIDQLHKGEQCISRCRRILTEKEANKIIARDTATNMKDTITRYYRIK